MADTSKLYFVCDVWLAYVMLCVLVSEVELKRLKEAFKRSSSLSGYMSKTAFFREVLGDNVPLRLAEVTSYCLVFMPC